MLSISAPWTPAFIIRLVRLREKLQELSSEPRSVFSFIVM